MENRIKELRSLFSDRLSTETLPAKQLRLYFSSLTHVLLQVLRRLGRAGTAWATAQVGTLRLRLLKIAAAVRITARRIWVRYSDAYPWKHLFAAAWSACSAEPYLPLPVLSRAVRTRVSLAPIAPGLPLSLSPTNRGTTLAGGPHGPPSAEKD